MAGSAPARAATPKDENRHSGKLLLRMPPTLHSDLAKAAEREGTSLNAYITQTLSSALNGEQPEPPPPASGPSRFLRIAVIIDLVMVAIATAAAVALLIVAWP